jgi:excisionase family DNA binding protein
MQPNVIPFEPLISAVEAGKLLGFHPVTLLRWAREGRVPHRRLGRKVKFRTSELNFWCTTLYTESAVRVAQPLKGEGT